MSRLYNHLNEKINKKEINDILNSTGNSVLVGAEFEFKVNLDEIPYIADVILKSREYDDDISKYNTEHREWEDNFRRRYEYYLDDEFGQDRMDRWVRVNPEPMEPEMPNNYVSTNNEDSVDFEIIKDFVDDYIFLNTSIDLDNGWDLKYDSSVHNGIELVSPPMDLDNFFINCKEVFDVIDKIGFTDNQCGLHIGVSLKKGMDKVDPVKLCLFMDENYIWNVFEHRKASKYCKSVQSIIKGSLYKEPENWDRRIKGEYTGDDAINNLKQMIKQDKLKNFVYNISISHYNGVNIEHLDSDDPYIEFRYMGGSGYHKKFDTIKVVVAQYIYNLLLARDPNFKKKEYIQKANRILLKLETCVIMNERDRISEMIDSSYTMVDRGILSNKNLLGLKRHLKKLNDRIKLLPKLTDTEKEFITRSI